MNGELNPAFFIMVLIIRDVENKECHVCKRKIIKAEKSGSKFYYRSKLICDNCLFYRDGKYTEIKISTRKIIIKSTKDLQKYKKLSIIDITNNDLIGEYVNSEILKKDFIAYKNKNPENEIKIIDRMSYHDLTNHFE